MFQRRRKRNDLLLAAFGLDKADCHIFKIHIGDFDIQKRAGAVSRGNQIIDGCPRPPLYPTVSLRAFEQAAQFCVGIRLFDGFILFHQFQRDRLHIFPFRAEFEEHAQSPDARI